MKNGAPESVPKHGVVRPNCLEPVYVIAIRPLRLLALFFQDAGKEKSAQRYYTSGRFCNSDHFDGRGQSRILYVVIILYTFEKSNNKYLNVGAWRTGMIVALIVRRLVDVACVCADAELLTFRFGNAIFREA